MPGLRAYRVLLSILVVRGECQGSVCGFHGPIVLSSVEASTIGILNEQGKTKTRAALSQRARKHEFLQKLQKMVCMTMS